MEFLYFVAGHLVGNGFIKKWSRRLLWDWSTKTDTFGMVKLIEVWWAQKSSAFRVIVFWGWPLAFGIWYVINNVYDWEHIFTQYETITALNYVAMFYAGMVTGIAWQTKHRIVYIILVIPSVTVGLYFYGEYRLKDQYVAKTGAPYTRRFELALEDRNKQLMSAFIRQPTRFFMVTSINVTSSSKYAAMLATELALRGNRVLFTTPEKLRQYFLKVDETGASAPKEIWYPHEVQYLILDDVDIHHQLTAEDLRLYKELAAFVKRRHIFMGWVRLDKKGAPQDTVLQALFRETYQPQLGETTYFDLDKIDIEI